MFIVFFKKRPKSLYSGYTGQKKQSKTFSRRCLKGFIMALIWFVISQIMYGHVLQHISVRTFFWGVFLLSIDKHSGVFDKHSWELDHLAMAMRGCGG